MARLKNTLIYSRKAYRQDSEFAKNVELTSKESHSLEHHKELLQELYPTYTITELYTYEHSGMCIEKFRRCHFDSSLDGMAAFKNEKDLDKKISLINEEL
jgi:hypothetical protein